jgi:hypothetical protein
MTRLANLSTHMIGTQIPSTEAKIAQEYAKIGLSYNPIIVR